MNDVLRELARQREARQSTAKVEEKQEHCASQPLSQSKVSVTACVGGRRSKGTPKRNPAGLGSLERKTGSGSKGGSPDVTVREETTEAAPRKKRGPSTEASTGAEESAVQKKRKVKKDAREPVCVDFMDAGGAFDAADVARSFLCDEFREGRDDMGHIASDQFRSAARIHAIEKNKVTITEEGNGVYIRVVFRGTSSKEYAERCRGYTADEITSILRNIVKKKQSASTRRASSVTHLLTPIAFAERYPPILWGVFRQVSRAAPRLDDLERLVQDCIRGEGSV